jgi:hypothetical protein
MSALTHSRIARGAVVAVLAGGTLAGAVSLSSAAPASTTHTLKFTTTQVADHIVGFQDIAVDVEKQAGKFVGYDTTDCKMNPQNKTARCEVSIARPEGTMRALIRLDLNTGLATGTVNGGTRAYRGVTGTVSGKSATQNRTVVTVRYHS